MALETGEFRVYVAPSTTRAPSESDEDGTIKLGGPTRRKLGLAGDLPSWIVCTEVNDFVWRGFDVVALDDGRDHCGALPDPVFEATRSILRERLRRRVGGGDGQPRPEALVAVALLPDPVRALSGQGGCGS